MGDERKASTAGSTRGKRQGSPYFKVQIARRLDVTRNLLAAHPLDGPTLVAAVQGAWKSIFESSLGGFKIGVDIFPVPQTMGFFLHELIPLRIAATHSGWRREIGGTEKDLVFIPNEKYSIEIKTSSDRTNIYGNRSFGLESPGKGKKAKDGFYLTVNFQKWSEVSEKDQPSVSRIRFGWLDHTDWMAQNAQSGQNSTLPADVYNTQLLTLFKR